MQTLESHFSHVEILLTPMRGWKNLNLAAKVLVDNQATRAANAMPMAKLARMMGMDASHISRLLDNKPGFVRTYRQNGDKQPVGTGIYYLVSPMLTTARAEAEDRYYPRSLNSIANDYIKSGMLKAIIHKYSEEELSPISAAPDPLIATLLDNAGVKPTSEVIVPVLIDNVHQSYGDLTRAIEALIEEMPEINLLDLPDKDLQDVAINFARIAWKATNNYYTVTKVIEGRELK